MREKVVKGDIKTFAGTARIKLQLPEMRKAMTAMEVVGAQCGTYQV